jgi:hypothetical protein
VNERIESMSGDQQNCKIGAHERSWVSLIPKAYQMSNCPVIIGRASCILLIGAHHKEIAHSVCFFHDKERPTQNFMLVVMFLVDEFVACNFFVLPFCLSFLLFPPLFSPFFHFLCINMIWAQFLSILIFCDKTQSSSSGDPRPFHTYIYIYNSYVVTVWNG